MAMICSGSEDELLMIACLFMLVAIMCILNVNAYKNIKKFAHDDKPV